MMMLKVLMTKRQQREEGGFFSDRKMSFDTNKNKNYNNK